jgi:hypothetical protein
VARSGRAEAGWHYYLAPSGLGRRRGLLDQVDYQGPGGYVVAPPSRHASGHPYRWVRDLDHPLPQLPGPLRTELTRPAERPTAPVVVPLLTPAGPGHPYARAALAEELARVATAPRGSRNQQLWESGPQPVQLRRRRRPRRARGPPGSAAGRRPQRAAPRGAPPDPADPPLGASGGPGPPPPASRAHRRRPCPTHPADPAAPQPHRWRADQHLGEEVRSMAAAGT